MIGISIISVILIVVVAYIFFKITKIIWKTILFTLLIILVVVGVTGFLVYQDVQEVINGKNGILVISEEGVQTGAILYNEEEIEIEYFKEEDLNTYSGYFKNNDYKSALGDKSLLIIFNSSMFDNLDKSISIDDMEFSTKEGIDLIMSNSTIEFLDKAIEVTRINDTIITKDKMIEYKLQITLILIEELLREEDGSKILLENTKFYPERLTIKLIKQTPSLIDKILPK